MPYGWPLSGKGLRKPLAHPDTSHLTLPFHQVGKYPKHASSDIPHKLLVIHAVL